MKEFSYKYLLAHKAELLDTNSWLYKATKEISDSIPNKKVKVANNVYRMCNTYVVENAIKDWLNLNEGLNAHFFGYKEHEYYHEGKGDWRPDLIDETGWTYEIKSPNCPKCEFDYENNSCHNAKEVLFYDRFEKQLWRLDYKNKKNNKLLAEIDIELPFPNK